MFTTYKKYSWSRFICEFKMSLIVTVAICSRYFTQNRRILQQCVVICQYVKHANRYVLMNVCWLYIGCEGTVLQ